MSNIKGYDGEQVICDDCNLILSDTNSQGGHTWVSAGMVTVTVKEEGDGFGALSVAHYCKTCWNGTEKERVARLVTRFAPFTKN